MREVAEDTDPTSDAVDEPVDAGFILSIVLARRVRKGVVYTEVVSSREMVEPEGREVDALSDDSTGKWMRAVIGVEKLDVGLSGFSTVTPVVFGDKGEAMMGSGSV